ncbi:MAG TPA: HlyD family efflux transporter periplasmic adaptor subunit [Spirochaetota bacterium]|nr:HlyD family efflux transporter periplasmic adaptor subunit [Spirochaetota bacterium]
MKHIIRRIKARPKLLAGAALLAIAVFVISVLLGDGETSVKPKKGPVADSVFALGTVRTDRLYNVRFGMNTVIRKLYVHEGDTVSSGSPLVMNDSSPVARSPFSGVVTSVSYLEGELAPAGQAILSVAGLESMYIKVSLDQESILHIRKGQAVELSFENMRSEKIKGSVSSVYVSGDEFLVRIQPDNLPGWVLPGMTCDAAILIRQKDNAIMIPSNAIVNGSVLVKRRGKRMSIRIASKPVDEKWSEITDGSILEDDLVFVSGKRPVNQENSSSKK